MAPLSLSCVTMGHRGVGLWFRAQRLGSEERALLVPQGEPDRHSCSPAGGGSCCLGAGPGLGVGVYVSTAPIQGRAWERVSGRLPTVWASGLPAMCDGPHGDTPWAMPMLWGRRGSIHEVRCKT